MKRITFFFLKYGARLGKDGVQQLLGHFQNLANLIAEFPLLAEEGRFVFVPGPRDPGAGNTLPRPPVRLFQYIEFRGVTYLLISDMYTNT